MFVKNMIMTLVSVFVMYLFVLAVMFTLKYDANIFTMSFVIVVLLITAYAFFPFKTGGIGTKHINSVNYNHLEIQNSKKVSKSTKRKKRR